MPATVPLQILIHLTAAIGALALRMVTAIKDLLIGGLVIAGMLTFVPGRILGNLLWNTLLAHAS